MVMQTNNLLRNAEALQATIAPFLPFGDWQCLRSLDLSFNQLTELGEPFWAGLPRLAKLQL